MATRFYINCPLAPGLVTLTGAEAHHLSSVCRLRPGDAVCLFNGDGREYVAAIEDIARRTVTLQVIREESPARESAVSLEVAAPLPKGDRAQFLIEKLTELGAAAFVPLECERSVIEPSDAKIEKMRRYVIEASKQCGRNVLMRIAPVAVWREYVARQLPNEVRWVGHPRSGAQAPSAGALATATSARIAVGPEGGFTDAEVKLSIDHGWKLVDLGPRILRIETAALLLLAWAQRDS